MTSTPKTPHKGLSLFEYNGKTGELLKATYETVPNEGEEALNKLKTKDFCIYFWALNEKSAIKKLYKRGLIKSKVKK